jgi:hypothetical protein
LDNTSRDLSKLVFDSSKRMTKRIAMKFRVFLSAPDHSIQNREQ